jgi:flagellar biosynthesis regulator FlbT
MVGIRNKTKNLCNELKKIKEMIKENPLYEKLKEEHGNV